MFTFFPPKLSNKTTLGKRSHFDESTTENSIAHANFNEQKTNKDRYTRP